MLTGQERDHGGGIDAARARYGGSRIGWADLSTGINPHPYPVPSVPQEAWTALPDQIALAQLTAAARACWNVPDGAAIIAASGASALIAQIPGLISKGRVAIPGPTYNEHAAAFRAYGWEVAETGAARAQVVVHPNNPDGRVWTAQSLPVPDAHLTVIDESFCDTLPEKSLIATSTEKGTLVLKSFGKFWGLAGLRLGFAIGDPTLIAQLRDRLGPWAVAGPALDIGAAALRDHAWAEQTRLRLAEDRDRLDHLMQRAGAEIMGGTTLFRLYRVDDAAAWQDRLARHHVWSRCFPYDAQWLRLGLPHALHWPRLEAALA